MRLRTRPLLATLAIVLLCTGNASATQEDSEIGPPYYASYAPGDCEVTPPSPLGSCRSIGHAEEGTGELGLDLSVASALDGTLPGIGGSSGYAVLVVGHEIVEGSASRLDYEATLRIKSAHATTSNGALGVGQHIAGMQAELAVLIQGCESECGIESQGEPQTIVNAAPELGPSSRTEDTITLRASLTTSAGTLPGGLVAVAIIVSGTASLDGSGPGGTVSVAIDAVAERVIARSG